jgi:hypothetical protein
VLAGADREDGASDALPVFRPRQQPHAYRHAQYSFGTTISFSLDPWSGPGSAW